jgi:hypothetical protein
MRGVMTGLGDRLLDRLVPKATATADTQAAGFVSCYCGDIGSPPPGNQYPCQWIQRLCDRNGSCTSCRYVGGWCCA